MTFRVAGSKLSGPIHINNSTCVRDGTVSGTLSGNRINFGAVHAAQQISFTGALSGDTMSGTYSAPSCGGDKGTWTAIRS